MPAAGGPPPPRVRPHEGVLPVTAYPARAWDGTPAPNYFNLGYHSTKDAWLGLAGYDAIEVDGANSRHGSYGKGVILNRSIVNVQKESAKGHVIR